MVQTANIKGLKQFSRFYIWVFRGTPLIVQLFIIFFGLPSVGIVLDAFPSAVIAFALNLGAYNAEIFRSAIQAVPQGQTEAAYMIGLNYPQTMLRVVMPQAFRIAFPAIIQFPDRINQGYLPCFQHYCSGTFYHRTADRSQNLRTVRSVLRSSSHLSNDLHGFNLDPKLF